MRPDAYARRPRGARARIVGRATTIGVWPEEGGMTRFAVPGPPLADTAPHSLPTIVSVNGGKYRTAGKAGKGAGQRAAGSK